METLKSGGFSTVKGLHSLDQDKWAKVINSYGSHFSYASGYHRKMWETVLALETIETQGKLDPDCTALGFGCGVEVVPSILAGRGVQVTASDLDGGGWHRSSLDTLTYPEEGGKHLGGSITFRPVDMNWIPEDLGTYDFVWSLCSLDHLGSIRLSKRFIYLSLNNLKPGGTAVHTGEYCISSDWCSVDYEKTVLWTSWDIKECLALVREYGCEAYFDWDLGGHQLDLFESQTQPEQHVHLKLKYKRNLCTSFGLVIKAPEDWKGGLTCD